MTLFANFIHEVPPTPYITTNDGEDTTTSTITPGTRLEAIRTENSRVLCKDSYGTFWVPAKAVYVSKDPQLFYLPKDRELARVPNLSQ